MENDDGLVNSAKIYPHFTAKGLPHIQRLYSGGKAPGRDAEQFQRSFLRWAQRDAAGLERSDSDPGSSEAKSSGGHVGSGSSCPLLIRIKPKLIPAPGPPCFSPGRGISTRFAGFLRGDICDLRLSPAPSRSCRSRLSPGDPAAWSREQPGDDVKNPSREDGTGLWH